MADAVVTKSEECATWVKKIKFSITSATDGTATATTTGNYTGEVLQLVVVPGTSTDQPTNEFDIAVNGEDGYDILAGQGADIDNTATTIVMSNLGCVVNDVLALSASGMGAVKKADVILYLR